MGYCLFSCEYCRDLSRMCYFTIFIYLIYGWLYPLLAWSTLKFPDDTAILSLLMSNSNMELLVFITPVKHIAICSTGVMNITCLSLFKKIEDHCASQANRWVLITLFTASWTDTHVAKCAKIKKIDDCITLHHLTLLCQTQVLGVCRNMMHLSHLFPSPFFFFFLNSSTVESVLWFSITSWFGNLTA